MKFALIKNLFILFLFTVPAFAAPADFNRTFSGDGKVTTAMDKRLGGNS